MIIVFTGKGKGKTTAAIGAALRAIENDKKIVIVQFLKTGSSSEIKFFKRIKRNFYKKLEIKSFGKSKFTDPKNLSKKDFEIATKACKFISAKIQKKPFLIVLDETFVALKFKLIKLAWLIEIINLCKDKEILLVLTGRGAPKKIIEMANLVTEMKNIKHPFEKNIKAIKGIDF